MSNLLPPDQQKRVRRDLRARFLLAFSLVLFGSAVAAALALVPAEVATVSYSPPPAQTSQTGTNVQQDNAAIAHTKALLAAMRSFTSTSSPLSAITDALSHTGQGVTINDISDNITGSSLTLGGHAATPDEVNTFRQDLQNDPDFSNISVPVSALLGSGSGSFTITMSVKH